MMTPPPDAMNAINTSLFAFRMLWLLTGGGIATVVFWFINRKVIKLQATASLNLANTLDRQVKALERERDDYRTKLHDERNTRQAIELRCAELEARPNLTTLTALLEDQKNWMRSLGRNLDEQVKSLKEHSESDVRIFGKLEQAISRYPDELQRMSDAFNERQKEALAEIRREK